MKSSFKYWTRTVAAAAVLATTGFASAQTAQFGTVTQYTSNSLAGTWFFNAATGNASYCNPVQNTSGSPQGRCAVVGSVGTSAGGFGVQLAGSVLWVTSKTTGAIHQCSFVLFNGLTPRGGCAQVSTLAILQ